MSLDTRGTMLVCKAFPPWWDRIGSKRGTHREECFAAYAAGMEYALRMTAAALGSKKGGDA